MRALFAAGRACRERMLGQPCRREVRLRLPLAAATTLTAAEAEQLATITDHACLGLNRRDQAAAHFTIIALHLHGFPSA